MISFLLNSKFNENDGQNVPLTKLRILKEDGSTGKFIRNSAKYKIMGNLVDSTSKNRNMFATVC